MPSRTQKFRGSRTHGRGRKAGRGSGKRGGTGNAGLGSHKKILVLKNPDRFSRRGSIHRKGFVHRSEDVAVLNIQDLERFVGSELNLRDLGYSKLLGRGEITRAVDLTARSCSKIAREKVTRAGGSITLE